jgi:hypothetical protein
MNLNPQRPPDRPRLTHTQRALLTRLYNMSADPRRLVEGPTRYANGLGGSNVAGRLRRGPVEKSALRGWSPRTVRSLEALGLLDVGEEDVVVHWTP